MRGGGKWARKYNYFPSNGFQLNDDEQKRENRDNKV
jgi:hypothetical protein